MEVRVIVGVRGAGTRPTLGVIRDAVLSDKGVHNAIVLEPVEQAVNGGLVDPLPNRSSSIRADRASFESPNADRTASSDLVRR